MLPLPTAASAEHLGEPPPYDLGFRVCPASEGVRVYAIVWIAFACAGHDLAGPASEGPTRSCCPCPRQPWRSTRGSRSRTIRLKGFALHMKMYPANQDLRNLCHSVNRGRMHRPRPRWVLRAKALLPLPTAASAKHWGEPPPYDLGFRVSPAYEGVRIYAILCKSRSHAPATTSLGFAS